MEAVGEVFESTEHFLSLGVNSTAAKFNTIEVNGDLFFKSKKLFRKKY